MNFTTVGSNSGVTSPTLPAPSGANQSLAPAIPIPGGTLPGYGNFNAVTCTAISQCLAVGGTDSGTAVAAITSNAGSTWASQSVPQGTTTLDAVSCGGPTNCVAVGQGDIMSTSDGGNSWSEQAPPSKNTTLLGVSCATPTQCVAAGVSPIPSGPYSGDVDVSSNGGATWTQASMPQGTQALGGVACPTTTFCVAVGGSIMVSSDGGNTWSPRTLTMGMQSPLRSVTCTSALDCVAVGANVVGETDSTLPGEAIVTTDGGTTWQPESMPSNTAFIDQITCVGGSQCFALGSDDTKNGAAAFEASTDGGVTWQEEAPPAGMSQIADLACPAVNNCVAVGRQGSQADHSRHNRWDYVEPYPTRDTTDERSTSCTLSTNDEPERLSVRSRKDHMFSLESSPAVHTSPSGYGRGTLMRFRETLFGRGVADGRRRSRVVLFLMTGFSLVLVISLLPAPTVSQGIGGRGATVRLPKVQLVSSSQPVYSPEELWGGGEPDEACQTCTNNTLLGKAGGQSLTGEPAHQSEYR